MWRRAGDGLVFRTVSERGNEDRVFVKQSNDQREWLLDKGEDECTLASGAGALAQAKPG